MTDDSKIVHNKNNSTALSSAGAKKKPGLPGLFARKLQHEAAKAETQNQAVEMPNRIVLLLDVSGSMGGERIEHLRLAYDGFVSALNLSDTSLAVAHFGYDDDPAHDLSLTTDRSLIMITGIGLHAANYTPMGEAMQRALATQPITRAVLISDGSPNGHVDVFEQANDYRDAGVPIDCVHISETQSGEDVLKKIAEITGGVYIKFRKTENLAKFLSYLTPAGRALMLSGNVSAAQIGADEIKFLK